MPVLKTPYACHGIRVLNTGKTGTDGIRTRDLLRDRQTC
jgi:hypothetical protein